MATIYNTSYCAAKETMVEKKNQRSIFVSATERLTILTGKVEEHHIQKTSEKLATRLRFAKEIIAHVNQTIHFSTNHPNRDNPFREKGALQTLRDTKEKHLTMKLISQEVAKEHRKNKPKECARLGTIFKLGNCEIMCYVGYFYAEKELKKTQNINRTSVRMFYTPEGDHAFLLLKDFSPFKSEENPNLDIQNPDAVICDPWSGAYFSAIKHKQYLRTYEDTTPTLSDPDENKPVYPIVHPFNPDKHNLVCILPWNGKKIKPYETWAEWSINQALKSVAFFVVLLLLVDMIQQNKNSEI